jgi:uncharacterized SAM-binding protein YcdF (DUF218 family)
MAVTDHTDRVSSANPRIRRSIILFLLGAVLIAPVGFETPRLLTSLGRHWVVSDNLESADAVAILGGGYESRPVVAAQLYKSGRTYQILIPTVRSDNDGMIAPGSLELGALVKLGIPRAAVTGFGNGASNTYEEARALALWAEQTHAQRIIVPTEIFCSRRVRWIMERELSKVGARVILETIAPKTYDVDHWWRSEQGISDFRTEFIKYVYYRIRYARS